MQIAVIDALARSRGERYTSFDVVGCGPRIVAGIAEEFGTVELYPYEKAVKNTHSLLKKDVIMFSAMSSDYPALYKLVSQLRGKGFRGNVVVGGPISFEYARLLRSGLIDFVVIGEAEIPLRGLLSYLSGEEKSLNSTPAIAYRDRGGVVKTTSSHVHTPRELLSTIKPWTRINEAFDAPQIYRFYVEIVRGCSNFRRPMVEPLCIKCFKCTSSAFEARLECPSSIPPGCGFCSVPHVFGPPRSRSVKVIVEEVSELVKHGARRIVLSAPDVLDYGRDELLDKPLTDPCYPPANVSAIESLLNELTSLEEVKRGKVVIMIENVKACLVDENVGEALGKYLKGTTVHIGLETGCDWFNEKVLGKPITVEHVLKASKILRDRGLRPYVYLMYGLPMATKEVYLSTIKALNELRKCGVEKITLYKYLSLPATAFEELGLKPSINEHWKLINKIKDLVDKYNLNAKKELLGKEIEVFLFESGNRLYGYPVNHGPVVFVKGSRATSNRGKLHGCRGVVRVVGVSSRFVTGILISVLEC